MEAPIKDPSRRGKRTHLSTKNTLKSSKCSFPHILINTWTTSLLRTNDWHNYCVLLRGSRHCTPRLVLPQVTIHEQYD